jgi:GT2 family glycosyltransferase
LKSHQQRHLADLSRQQRFRLEGLRATLDESSGELVDTVMLRMFDIEHALLADLDTRSPRRRLTRRLAELTQARIGHLRHHGPIPVLLPASYWDAEPPEPAPPIAIVTPSYGQGEFIERTICSVTRQRYPALEYVVQDGGSRDQTVSVLRHHADELTHWSSARDGGHADALNRGFARTSAPIMAYLNSDDLLLPGSLAYVARYFEAHPNADAVYGHRLLINESDQLLGRWVMPPHDDEAMTLVDYIPQETLFWRRRIWDATGGYFDTSLNMAIDWDLLLRFHAAGARIVRLPRFLGAFRVHDAQKTQRDQALNDIDCERLRIRAHGREVPLAEAIERTKPYLRRQVRAHLAYRAGELLRGRTRSRPLEIAAPVPLDAHARESTAASPRSVRSGSQA